MPDYDPRRECERDARESEEARRCRYCGHDEADDLRRAADIHGNYGLECRDDVECARRMLGPRPW